MLPLIDLFIFGNLVQIYLAMCKCRLWESSEIFPNENTDIVSTLPTHYVVQDTWCN